MQVGADNRTRHHHKQRRVQCVENSDHYALASAGVTFVQDGALSLLSVPNIATPDRRCAVVLVPYAILFLCKYSSAQNIFAKGQTLPLRGYNFKNGTSNIFEILCYTSDCN